MQCNATLSLLQTHYMCNGSSISRKHLFAMNKPSSQPIANRDVVPTGHSSFKPLFLDRYGKKASRREYTSVPSTNIKYSSSETDSRSTDHRSIRAQMGSNDRNGTQKLHMAPMKIYKMVFMFMVTHLEESSWLHESKFVMCTIFMCSCSSHKI